MNAKRYLRMQNEIKYLSQKYDLEYYNYLRDKRFTAEDFFNSNHLSTKGAEKFSRILKDEVVAKHYPAP
jgi:hypothetical protein